MGAEKLRDTLYSYVNLGFPVVPIWGTKNGICLCHLKERCDKGSGKHPNPKLAPNGFKNATLDTKIISDWIRRYPESNWGIATGCRLKNGKFLVVLDVDPRSGGDDSLFEIEQRYGKLPITPTQLTGGGGYHYLFASETEIQSSTLGPGLDLKGLGGYVLVDPSLHTSGRQYTWDIAYDIADTEIADAPSWLVKGGTKYKDRPAPDGDTARDTLLGEAFFLAERLGVPLQNGDYAVICPWADKHSDGRGRGKDNSTVILKPAGGSNFGGFKCLHGHCTERKWVEVLNALPEGCVQAAKKKHPPITVVAPVPKVEKDEPVTEDPKQDEVEKFNAGLKFNISKKTGLSKLSVDLVNISDILKGHPKGWKSSRDNRSVLRWNEYTSDCIFLDKPPYFDGDEYHNTEAGVQVAEEDITAMRKWFIRFYDVDVKKDMMIDSMLSVAKQNSFHPVRDWLKTIEWDGIPRLDSWLHTYLGVRTDLEYASLVGKWWMLSAVARAMKPGCKADYVLVLQGPQGIGKSTALNVLASTRWFSDTPFEIGSKDSYVVLRGKWIVELPELEAILRSKESGDAKAFFSSPEDTYRPPYGKTVISVPRSCIFAGTVNVDFFLSDNTGNRRYWPVRCTVIDLESLRRDREQLWAEAVALYLKGDKWWPETEAHRSLCEVQQDARREPDTWLSVVATWLESDEAKFLLDNKGYWTIDDVGVKALGFKEHQLERRHQYRIGSILDEIGLFRIRPRIGNKRIVGYVKEEQKSNE